MTVTPRSSDKNKRTVPTAVTLQCTIRRESDNIEFDIYAYRPLTDDERDNAIALFLISRKRKPKPGSRLRVFTEIGKDATAS